MIYWDFNYILRRLEFNSKPPIGFDLWRDIHIVFNDILIIDCTRLYLILNRFYSSLIILLNNKYAINGALKKLAWQSEKRITNFKKFILEQENYSKLNLSEKKLTDDDISIVIQFPIDQCKCTELKLSNSSITFKDAKILSTILWNNQSVLTLYFLILVFIINIKSLNSIISKISNIKIIFNIKW